MCGESRVAPKEAAGPPKSEIEFTPETIEAGADAIRLYEAGDAEMAAFSFFTAMVRVFRLCHNDDMPQRILGLADASVPK
jgi:hypothetical protein